MPDLLSSGATWLAAQLKTAAGTTVTYRRGGTEAQITATIGDSAFESAGQSGVVERWESRDYLVSTADLPFGDPERGDVIVENGGGLAVEYQVVTPNGVPPWHYGDAFRQIVRIHTTQTESGVTYITTEANEQLTTEAGELLVV